VCRDEIELEALQAGGKLKLTLVDHNVLSSADAHLQSSVVRVIDHHKREKALDRRDTIESVGSCSTLVAQIVLGLFDRDPIVCNLLFGEIIITPLQEEMLN
jgi:exopolyphosphatase